MEPPSSHDDDDDAGQAEAPFPLQWLVDLIEDV